MGFLAWGLQVRTSFAVALCMCLRAALRCMGRAARRARQPRSVSVARMRCQQPSIQTVMIMVPAFMGMIITILQFRVRLELNVIVALFHECLCKSSGTLSTLAVNNNLPLRVINKNDSLNTTSDSSLNIIFRPTFNAIRVG
uniref:Uncharacterized protein n=1 Tax=Lotharella oceanica TaxID=641309 RepID=A0A7S2X7B3_9EUKA